AVSAAGHVTAVGVGSATITAASESQSGTTVINVVPPLSFALISASGEYTCGVATGGSAFCWGNNVGADGTGTYRTGPVAVSGGLSFTSISAGGATCGVTTGGTAYCWGDNTYGELGDGTTTFRTAPVPVSGGLTFASISAGGQ